MDFIAEFNVPFLPLVTQYDGLTLATQQPITPQVSLRFNEEFSLFLEWQMNLSMPLEFEEWK